MWEKRISFIVKIKVQHRETKWIMIQYFISLFNCTFLSRKTIYLEERILITIYFYKFYFNYYNYTRI